MAFRDNTTDKFTVASATGNTVIEGTVDIQLQTTITDGLLLQADNKKIYEAENLKVGLFK